MKCPNHEQQQAIDVVNGCLLSAGAGAGKTFVIIQMIIQKIQNFLDTNESKLKSDPFLANTMIREFLSSMILMTFTRKAAAEMKSRMIDRIDEKAADQEDFWPLIHENKDRLSITTIDGFCSRILKENIIPDLPSSFIIVDHLKFKNKIKKLMDQWLINSCLEDLQSYLLLDYDNLLKTIIQIFQSPDLRKCWSEASKDQFYQFNDDFFNRYLELLGETLCPELIIGVDFKAKSTASYVFYHQLQQMILDDQVLSSKVITKNDYDILINFIKNSKTFPKRNHIPQDANVQKFHFALKALRELGLEHGESIEFFASDPSKAFLWYRHLFELIQFIEDHYLDDAHFSYSDLEYYVEKGLSREPLALEYIRQSYKYFIVDEFQDTSLVQYNILKLLTGNDPSRVFAVGDKKQAIYSFRGGEISVFSAFEDDIINSNQSLLSLTSNYRSTPEIINFNNSFFRHLFVLGENFEGRDLFAVASQDQTIPKESLDLKGLVQFWNPKVRVSNKESRSFFDEVEAKYLCQSISDILSSSNEDSRCDVCVLYNKLGPSVYLIKYFIEQKMPFTAQVKVAYKNDATVLMAQYYLGLLSAIKKNDSKQEASYLFLLQGILHYFEKKDNQNFILSDNKISTLAQEGLYHLKYYGLQSSVDFFFFNLGIRHSTYSIGMEKVYQIIELSSSCIEECLFYLDHELEDKYSIEMSWGHSKVKIMTAHASKGLQFDHVLLGGIHSNGGRISDMGLIGKDPLSFKWNTGNKNWLKSMEHILENLSARLKDFSESKRLLYVACTRAIKSLTWVDIKQIIKDKNGQEVETPYAIKNSWINAFRSFCDLEHFAVIRDECFSDNESSLNRDQSQKSSKMMPQFYQMDNIGMAPLVSESSPLLVLSDLSVTRFSMLSACARKFYLANVLKIDPRKWDQSATSLVVRQAEDQMTEDKFYSSLKRGTRIHFQVSQYIKSGKVLEEKNSHDNEVLAWLKEIFFPYRNGFTFKSEEEIKLFVNSLPLSGIPDLVIQKDGEPFEVWDFKTGQGDLELEDVYWTQLKLYAQGLWALKTNLSLKQCLLKIIYLDTKSIKAIECSKDEVSNHIGKLFERTRQYDQINPAFCHHCTFNFMCTGFASS